jgi:hypothetical protein
MADIFHNDEPKDKNKLDAGIRITKTIYHHSLRRFGLTIQQILISEFDRLCRDKHFLSDVSFLPGEDLYIEIVVTPKRSIIKERENG